MKRRELIKKYLDFFISKNHKVIPNVSLIPENDPTTLFISAGMQPLVPNLLGQPHPLGKRLCNVQRCIRTGDIDEVGDTYHHTFFEMLGNWSLGDYSKEEAIKMTFEFQNKILKIPLENYAVTVFGGNRNSQKDEESEEVWLSQGIPKERIAFLNDNWWGPTGKTGPCGPDTEQFFWSRKEKAPKVFDPKDSHWIEIGNDVIMEYVKDGKGDYKPAKQKNIDFGGGVERTVAALDGLDDNYLADMWKPIIEKIEKLSGKVYGKDKEQTRAMRIIADHIKAAVFIISDGITPSNSEQGYVLRRLIRRAVRYGHELKIEESIKKISEPIFEIYSDYEHLKKNKNRIIEELAKEEEKFLQTLERGMNKFKKFEEKKTISGKDAFLLYQSYGFPVEMTKELAKEKGILVDEKEFEKELRKHQELSKTAARGRFKSGLADHSEKTTRMHTATHLLLAALRKVLNDKNIIQKGSNITPERIRLDFSFPRKLTSEEVKKVEDLVNEKIEESIEVTREEMSPAEAKKQGALGIFNEKYGDVVSVYTIGDFSKEICTGPHVKNTKEIGKFRIKKEESSSSGVRRIKGILE
jgi:alanyl-tRNA synthetase